ncbi:MAG: glyoxalase/bleomycin resistance/extradiol dioxygenase family protein, partial [Gorillibacterium sp.]|nr:glyoxalase/bleomycin resistance/extradiol dioxygenase family protein [Gorillibacterium sp.]
MRIDHIAMWTNNLENMKQFYIKYFQAAANDKYTNEVKQFTSYFLKFDSGTRLELMSRPIT